MHLDPKEIAKNVCKNVCKTAARLTDLRRNPKRDDKIWQNEVIQAYEELLLAAHEAETIMIIMYEDSLPERR
jgi:hypothetical protein